MTTQVATMTTQEVADRLYQLLEEGKWKEAQDELFSQDAKSVEPPNAPGLHTVEGLDNIKKKGEMFEAMVEEMHGGYTGKPVVAGNHFAIPMGMDATMKGAGRMNMEEIAVYEVKDGKIVKEHFFF